MIPPSLTDHLEAWIEEGRTRIGEVAILRRDPGWRLVHRADVEDPGLEVFADPHAALSIARLDSAGAWRPLRSAPTLRRGWALDLADLASVRLALEFLYPAAVGNYAAYRAGKLRPTPLRDVLERQTGRYQAARDLTDAQAAQLIPAACSSDGRCLKTLLWPLRDETPIPLLPAAKSNPDADSTGGLAPCIPLLCTEACPLLLDAIRRTVKGTGR